MPKYLYTRNRSTVAIGICDTCGLKYALADLMADGDKPGLRVCSGCYDMIDFWRVPFRPADKIALPFVRPDRELELPAEE